MLGYYKDFLVTFLLVISEFTIISVGLGAFTFRGPFPSTSEEEAHESSEINSQ